MPTTADIYFGDTHVGHKSGLIYPDPNSEYRPSDSQLWLFKCWNLFIDDVEGLLSKYKVDYVHGLAGGDLGDMDYKGRGATEYWANDAEEVRDNTAELFDPLVKLCNDIHFLQGNDAHVGKFGALDNYIAKDFSNTAVPVNKGRKQYAWPSTDYELQGIMFNSVHKGANKTKWTDVNAIASLSKEVLLDRAKNGERIPDVLVRFHFHYHGQLRDIRPHPIAVASFQLKSDYIRYIDNKDTTPVVGGHVVIIRDGVIIHTEPLVYTMERRKPWRPRK